MYVDCVKMTKTEREDKEKSTIPLKCHNCSYEWDYKGSADFYAPCPRCSYKVHIDKHRIDGKGKSSKKENLKEDLEAMDYGSRLIKHREKGNPIQIEKNLGITEFFAEDRLVKRKPEYWIQERKGRVLRGTLIILSPEDIEELEKKAKGEGKELIDEFFDMVDLQKSSIKKLEEYLRSTFSKSKKKIEDYGSV